MTSQDVRRSRPGDPEIVIRREIERVTVDLSGEYPTASPERIRSLVEAAASSYRAARVRDFVPVLVHREVAATLRRTSVA